ncbi:MAG: hypothetical protein HC888_00890 [Candidatus Competibacteraceae bacterium]|nr:hypothetical protein [Candidatus Competibacteraceae bacterium]
MRKSEMDLVVADESLKELERIYQTGEELGLLKTLPNTAIPKFFDWAAEEVLDDPNAKAKRKWRKDVERIANVDTLERLAALGGSDTEREFQWMREMSPKVGDTASSFESYIGMQKVAIEKIRMRAQGQLTPEKWAELEARRQSIVDESGIDSYLAR